MPVFDAAEGQAVVLAKNRHTAAAISSRASKKLIEPKSAKNPLFRSASAPGRIAIGQRSLASHRRKLARSLDLWDSHSLHPGPDG
jgi:hypothetical protein